MTPGPERDVEGRPPLYFLHIPKTAGNTVSCYLAAGFRADEVCPATDWAAFLRLPPRQLEHYRLFHGHFGAMLPALLPSRPTIVSMVRDPVDRAVSHWRYIQRHADHRLHRDVMQQGPRLAAYLRSRIPNAQVRQLGVDRIPAELVHRFRTRPECHPHEASLAFDRWTSGHADLLERAVSRLEECFAFGVVERLDQSLALLAHALGWAPPSGVASLNVRPPNEPTYEPTSEEIEIIHERDALDVALYHEAVRMFDERWEALRPADARRAYEGRVARRSQPLEAPLTVDMSERIAGTGWLPPEETISGWARWMGPAGPASIDLPVVLPAGTRVEVMCTAAMSTELLAELTLELNGTPVPLTCEPCGRGVRYVGIVPEQSQHRPPFSRFVFRTPRTITWRLESGSNGDALDLAVAISWMRLVPRESLEWRSPPQRVASGREHGTQVLPVRAMRASKVVRARRQRS